MPRWSITIFKISICVLRFVRRLARSIAHKTLIMISCFIIITYHCINMNLLLSNRNDRAASELTKRPVEEEKRKKKLLETMASEQKTNNHCGFAFKSMTFIPMACSCTMTTHGKWKTSKIDNDNGSRVFAFDEKLKSHRLRLHAIDYCSKTSLAHHSYPRKNWCRRKKRTESD